MSESKKTKMYDELVYSDDFMFGKVMKEWELEVTVYEVIC